MDALWRTYRTEGVRGLYRGLGAVLVGGTPGTMLYLCSYELLKVRLGTLGGGVTQGSGGEFALHFSCGMLAETIACVIYVPVDVVKERMQVQHSTSNNMQGQYSNSWDALKQIMKTEGVSGIYRGYAATLASFGPFSALYFVFYERFKYWTRERLAKNDPTITTLDNAEIPFAYTLLSSCSAGALASWLTSPLDMAKLRLQIQRGKLSHPGETQVIYRDMLDCLRCAYRGGGIPGLFRGAGARVLHFAPATTITMTSYETFRSFFARNLSTNVS
jgi:Mitochondrial carrier protein